MRESYTTGSVEETMALAKRWATQLKPGNVVLLYGDLGAGKTHFVRGVASFFEIDAGNVHSPTYTLINHYEGDAIRLIHVDCYRLKRPEEALEIGIEDYLYDDSICLIEWPEHMDKFLPETYWRVQIKHLQNQMRQIEISRKAG